jgi:hypothetical protein
MADFRIVDYTAKALKAIYELMGKRLEAGAMYLENSIKEEISLTGVGQAAVPKGTKLASGRVTRRPKRTRIYGFARSKPGEPPRKQFGHLRRSITHDVDKANLTARVGTTLKVGRYLELGTRRMAARPYLRSTYLRVAPQIAQIFMAGNVPDAAPASWS